MIQVEVSIEKVIDDPDVEVEFEFIGLRKRPAYNGYRPAHLVGVQLQNYSSRD